MICWKKKVVGHEGSSPGSIAYGTIRAQYGERIAVIRFGIRLTGFNIMCRIKNERIKMILLR